MLLFIISFVAGVLTAIAPCVLPLLPVIVGGSVAAGERNRAYTITLSLGLSVILFTLLLKVSTTFISVPQIFWELFSGAILIGFGTVMVFPRLWDTLGFVNTLNRSSNQLLATGYQKNSLWGDIIMGAALGPVFSSCSPTYFVILATVLPASFMVGLLDLLAYAVGLSGFLLLVSLLGQRIVDKMGVAIEPNGWFRRSMGMLFLLVGIAVATGAEKNIEAWLLSHGFDFTGIEHRLLEARTSPSAIGVDSENANIDVDSLVSSTSVGAQGPSLCTETECNTSTSTAYKSNDINKPTDSIASFLTQAQKKVRYQQAPEVTDVGGYINTDGKTISIHQFKGSKVVLIDFWTYSCINCQRTLPYLKKWYEKYHDQGLEIIGVHTPEFAFERVLSNVQKAVQGFSIKYPVILDNTYGTWNAFGNQYWPRKYLIDMDGYIVYDHAGEGNYDETEQAIQKALKELHERLGMGEVNTENATSVQGISVDSTQLGSPETYFGASRNEFLGNGTIGQVGDQTLSLPKTAAIRANTLYLGGSWSFDKEFAQNKEAGAMIQFLYKAKNVYFVAAPSGKLIKIKVTIDGGKSLGSMKGRDVDDGGYVTIDSDRLYSLIEDSTYGIHLIEIEALTPGLQAYTFTFG